MSEAAAVTLVTVTQNAAMDELSERDYRDIYAEMRGWDEAQQRYGVVLDEFVVMVDSVFSKALWSKWHSGKMGLNRTMRNELRRAVGLAPLPPTVAEALADVDPNALVVRVGREVLNRVVLVGSGRPLLIAVDGTVQAWPAEPKPASALKRKARTMVRPVASLEQEQRRATAGVSWREVIEAGLVALEAV